jgi:hypothetical protein
MIAMTTKTENKTENIDSILEACFAQNEKFFNNGDLNGKRAFFTLGMYTRRVVEALEKEIATSGTQTKDQEKFTSRINREIGYNMTYRSFTTIIKLLDTMAAKVNPKLIYNCSNTCKQYVMNSNVMTDKKALPSADANLAFSLGMYQK